MFKQTLALVGLTFSLSANATLISHYGYTLDTNTDIVSDGQLEWLRWDVTRDSYDTVNNVLAQYAPEGWRLASNTEMVQLIEDFDFQTGFTAIENVTLDTGLRPMNSVSELPYLSFFELFGITNFDACPYDGCDGSQAVYGSDEDNDNKVKFASIHIHDVEYYDFGDVVLSSDWQSLDSEYHSSDSESGIALVRTVVPVPAAAWLFGSALIGLAGIKRKK